MSSNSEQLKRLKEKLNDFQTNPENGIKIKLTHLQELMKKIHQSFAEQSQLSELKAKQLLDILRKLQIRAKQQSQQLQKQDEIYKIKLSKADKISQRALQKMSKERKDCEKKINTALEGYLMELTSAKAKSYASCKFAVKQFSNIQMQLLTLQSEIESEESATKDITKKIYAQFSAQIQQLSQMLAQQKKQKQTEEQKLVTKLQKLYSKAHQSILNSSKQRQVNQQQVVGFLQKIIEKVKFELMNQ